MGDVGNESLEGLGSVREIGSSWDFRSTSGQQIGNRTKAVKTDRVEKKRYYLPYSCEP